MKITVLSSSIPCLALALLSAPLHTAQAQDKPAATATKEAGPKFTALDALTDPANLWEITPGTAEMQFGGRKAYMKWLSESKDRANIKRQPYSNVDQVLKIAGGKVDVEEVTMDFTEGKLARIAFSLWNKGDSEGSFDAKTFKAKIAEMTESLNGVFGLKGTDMGLDRTGAVKYERTQWLSPKLSAQLEYSGSKTSGEFKAEFIRLRIAPPLKQAALGSTQGTGGEKPAMSKADLAKNVQHDANGDVYINNVPMVDQGMKGYCAVATCQRVFNYFGMNIDEHEMAQVAQTGAGESGGTNPKKLMESLDAMEGRLKVHFKKLYDLETNKEFSALVTDYNRVSRKRGAKPLEWTTAQLDDMNAADLKEARSKGGDYNKFQRMVKEYVDKGVPLLWGLTLGLYPENGKPAMQNGGGHMRLIIGYNVKDPANPTLIFSDSWGAGHEKKTIEMADAFAATNGLIIIEPQQQK